MTEPSTARVALLLFDGVDLIDVAGPYEVLLTANRLAQRSGAAPPCEVVAVSPDGAPVRASGGLKLTPQETAGGDCDVLVMPGAIDIDGVLGDPRLRELVRRQAQRGGLVLSICTGAFVLGAAGLLDGRTFTTHFEDVDELARRAPAATPDGGARWVDAGSVVTGGGMTSGIAATLHLVERLTGRDLAQATARQIDYDWTERRD